MTTIKVKFRPSSILEREGSIYYQVIHERKPRQVLTEYKVYANEWNEYRASVSCSQNSPRCPYILSVRERIKVDLERLARIIRTFERERVEFTSDDIVDEYMRIGEQNSLFRYMNNIIAKLKFTGRVRTSETYKTALNSFRNFREGDDIMLESLNKEIMEGYEAWLRQRGLSSNTVSFYTRIIRAVYNRAVEDDLTADRMPFKRVFTGIEKTMKRALPMKIIKKIKSLDLTLNPHMDFARDMFLLSFMLRDMSFIDMAFLKKSDLSNGHVTYGRRKTGQLLNIKWTPEMQEIIDKYPDSNKIYLLPIIKNPEAISLYAYRNMGSDINRQLKLIANRLELPIPLTMYVARHSWASAAKARGIPVSVISEGMGHDSELTTQIYLASLDTSVVDRANSILIKDLNSK